MATNKRKTTTAVVASVAAAVLLLGGTFAWTSLSQMAKNESTGIVNVGGRLHDDFNGKNKDVYVENFTDPYNGGQPIYARVRLDEYMEVGSEAGKLDENGDYAANRKAVSVVDGATIDDVDSWSTHKPVNNCAECYENGELCVFHEHWEWEMGGFTTFMPTFNKDKDSLEADVNGTYQGTDATDKIYYDNYVEYTTDATNTDKVYSEEGTAHYDNDTDKEANTVEGQYTTKNETHYAKDTATAEVITMEQWLSEDTENGGKAGAPGNYWVYDTDGWAYWANPIMPGEATGLLLSNIEMTSNPGEKCYYAINVVGQFATVGDWEQFGVDEEDEDYPSTNAITLLTTASQNVPTVTVTNLDDVTLVKRGDTVRFSAASGVGGVSTLADDEYEWVVLDEERKKSETSTIEDNGDGTATLTVGNEELSAGLYVAAHSKNHGGAVGLSAVAVQLYTVTVTAEDDATEIYAGDSLQFAASVTDSNTGKAENSGVTWSVTGGSEADTSIDDKGILTVGENEAGGTKLTVTATSVNGSFTETYTVTVGYKLTLETTGSFDMVDGLRVDIKESYYNVEDIKAAISDDINTDQYHTKSNTKYNYEVNEDENGIYLMITHDDETYEFADHGTRQLTVKAAELAEATYDFTCNCHQNNSYTVNTSADITEISFYEYNDDIQVTLLNDGTPVDDQYITWNATTNSGLEGSYLDESKILYLDENEYSPYVRITYRTENAWGIKDLRIRYAKTEEVENMKVVVFRNNNPDSPEDTICYGDEREREGNYFDYGYTCMYLVYDQEGNIIDEPLNFSLWQDESRNITGVQGGAACTNGYVNAEGSSMQNGKGSYWIWVPYENTTPITFWISYVNDSGVVGTFEATIW